MVAYLYNSDNRKKRGKTLQCALQVAAQSYGARVKNNLTRVRAIREGQTLFERQNNQLAREQS